MPEEREGVWGSCMAAEGDEKLTVQLSMHKQTCTQRKKGNVKNRINFPLPFAQINDDMYTNNDDLFDDIK